MAPKVEKVDFTAVEAAIKPYVTSDECIDYDKDAEKPDPSKCKAHKKLLTALYKATWRQTSRFLIKRTLKTSAPVRIRCILGRFVRRGPALSRAVDFFV